MIMNSPWTTLKRVISYQVVDASKQSITIPLQVHEQFGSKDSNTCNTSITTGETCYSISNGVIGDVMTVGCNSVGGSCGFTYTHQQWVWCSSAGDVIIATPGDLIVHNNSISVGGNTTGFPAGTEIFR